MSSIFEKYSSKINSEELAASHGISEFFSGFTMDYIQNVLNTYITVDFLA